MCSGIDHTAEEGKAGDFKWGRICRILTKVSRNDHKFSSYTHWLYLQYKRLDAIQETSTHTLEAHLVSTEEKIGPKFNALHINHFLMSLISDITTVTGDVYWRKRPVQHQNRDQHNTQQRGRRLLFSSGMANGSVTIRLSGNKQITYKHQKSCPNHHVLLVTTLQFPL